MPRTIAVFAYLNVLVFAYFQNDYQLKYERYTDLYWNKDYFQEFHFGHTFFNRTTKVFHGNMTVIKPISTHVRFKLQTYKFLSNEYRYFPLYIDDNLCWAMAADVFGNSATHFDTNLKKCPVAKGFYYARNVTVNQRRLPPYAPRGRYRFDFTASEYGITLAKIKLYAKIVPTNPLEIVLQ